MKDGPTKQHRPSTEPNVGAAASNDRRNPRTRIRGTVSYTELEAADVLQFLSCITDAGAAVILGKTSDGGAYSVTILDGNERIREYAHTPEEFAETIKWLVSMFSTD